MKRTVALASLLAACAACATRSEDVVSGAAEPVAPPAAEAEIVRWSPDGTSASAVPRDVVDLFATRIQPTCSLNDGVCHASKNVPDLTSVASLLDAAFAPCRSPSAAKLPGCGELVPGRPAESFLVARLWDEELDPELMPRQCRAWDDMATRALACWVEGLVASPDGKVTEASAYAPIDYARCTFRVPRAGRCGGGATGVEAVFRANCTGCHGGSAPAAGLDLRGSAAALASALARPSSERPDVGLVAPGDPAASWLFRKLTQEPPAIDGARMPLGGALASADVEAVRAWIAGLAAP